MKEYITKDRAKQFVCGHCNEVCSEEPCEPRDCDWMAFIDKEPTADVMEVVRCRECKYSFYDEIFGNLWCNSHSGCRKVKDEGFCDLGERKEGADNG